VARSARVALGAADDRKAPADRPARWSPEGGGELAD